jgi:hypothetical protein
MNILEALRENIKRLENWTEQNKKPDASAKIDIEPEQALCCVCGKQMNVQKTISRKIVTLRYNVFNTHERVLECPSRCKFPSGFYVTARASRVSALAPTGSNYGYDLEVFVGMERFTRHRQREEIQSVLKEEYAISVSTGEISLLANRFLSHIEELHKIRSDDICAALFKDGGYPLHVDCTTESGKGTLLVILAGWRKWVLGSWKIQSESAASITPRILEVIQAFGEPCAIMRDLGQPIAKAVEDAANNMSRRPKMLACHFHFLRDVGKGLIDDDYDNLRKLVRKLSIRENIRSAIGAMRKKSDPEDMDYLHTWFDNWLNVNKYPSLPGMSWGFSLVISLGQWILDYSSDGRNLGFPFECPYHNFYRRCQVADKAIRFFQAETRFDHDVNKALERLKNTLSPLLESKEVRKTVRDLEMRMNLFDKFRNIFRIESGFSDSSIPENIRIPSNNSAPLDVLRCSAFEQFENDMRNNLERFEKNLRRKFESARSGAALKRSIKIILDHLNKHGRFLWGHLVELTTKFGNEIRLVDRTNNILENFFHEMKHGERRRSGRKILTRDFENIPPAAALAMNFKDPEYVNVVCGTLDNLPLTFSEIDQKRRTDSLNTPESENRLNIAFNDWNLISCTDKTFIRKDSVNLWVLAASNSKPIINMMEKPEKINIPPFDDMDQFLQTVRI